jgi:hypothetical protein
VVLFRADIAARDGADPGGEVPGCGKCSGVGTNLGDYLLRLRRSRELTHFRSVRVTHLKNRISV